MESTASNARRLHPGRQNPSRFHPGNRAEVFMAKFSAPLPRSREPSQPALSCERIENFTKDLEERRDLGNRAHVTRSSESCLRKKGKRQIKVEKFSK